MFDKYIHKFSVYARLLHNVLPKGQEIHTVDLDDKILMEYNGLSKILKGQSLLRELTKVYTYQRRSRSNER